MKSTFICLTFAFSNVALAGVCLTDNADGTLTDTNSGLIWQSCSLGQVWSGTSCTGNATRYSWTSALSAAVENRFLSENDWILPTSEQSKGLLKSYCQKWTGTFWTSSQYDPTYMSNVVDFDRGDLGSLSRGDQAFVRLVRASKSPDMQTFRDSVEAVKIQKQIADRKLAQEIEAAKIQKQIADYKFSRDAATFIFNGFEWARCPISETSIGKIQTPLNGKCPDSDSSRHDLLEAVKLVNELGAGWRLPTVNELTNLKLGLFKILYPNRTTDSDCNVLNFGPTGNGSAPSLAEIFVGMPRDIWMNDYANIWTSNIIPEGGGTFRRYGAQAEAFILPWCNRPTQVFNRDEVSIDKKLLSYAVRDLSKSPSPEWDNVVKLVVKSDELSKINSRQRARDQADSDSETQRFNERLSRVVPSGSSSGAGNWRCEFKCLAALYSGTGNKYSLTTAASSENAAWESVRSRADQICRMEKRGSNPFANQIGLCQSN